MTDDEKRVHFQGLADRASDSRMRRYFLECMDEVGKPFVRHADPTLPVGDPYPPRDKNALAWMRVFGHGIKRGG